MSPRRVGAAIVGLQGCSAVVQFPASIHDTAEPDLRIDDPSVPVGCTLQGAALWVRGVASAPWRDGEVRLLSEDHEEAHPVVATDPFGAFRVGPLGAEAPDDTWVAGESTLFTCDPRDVTYVLHLSGFGGLRDCVVWGLDPTGALDRPDVVDLGCRRLDAAP